VFTLAEVQVLEEKYPQVVVVPILISGWQLLEQVHIAELQVVMFVQVPGEPHEKSILVEIVVYDVLPEVDVQLIIQDEGDPPFFRLTGAIERNLEKQVVTYPVTE
jgi:hypothetical protein